MRDSRFSSEYIPPPPVGPSSLYPKKIIITKTVTTNSNVFDDIGHFIDNTTKACGRVVGSALNTVDKATGEIQKGIRSIPIVGAPLSAALDLLPATIVGPEAFVYKTAEAAITGKRIDRAALGTFNDVLNDAKTLEPYAQAVVSTVPIFGPPISGAMGVGMALASNQPIDKALVDGAKEMLPGGPLAKAAFDVGQGAITGQKIGNIASQGISDVIAITGIQIPPEAAIGINTALSIGGRVANGERIDSAADDAIIADLPPGPLQQAAKAGRQAVGGENLGNVLMTASMGLMPLVSDAAKTELANGLKTGAAVGFGQVMQNVMSKTVSNPAFGQMLGKEGNALVNSDAVAREARKLLNESSQKGFDIGLGFAQHQVGKYEHDLLRNSLVADAKKGFDTAMALHIGRVVHKAPNFLPLAGQAAYHVTKGLQGNPNSGNKAAIIKTITSNPIARNGAVVAIQEIAQARKSWWIRLLEWIGFDV